MRKLFCKYDRQQYKAFLTQLRWMAGLCRRFPGTVIWYSLLGLLGTAMGLASGVMGKIIVDIVTNRQTGPVVTVAIAYLSMQIIKILLTAFTGYISEHLRIRASMQIRGEIFDKIIHARWQNISKYHTGDLLTRAAGDTGTVAGSVVGWIPSFVITVFQFCGAFFLILYYDHTLAWLALATAPAVFLMSGFTTRRVRKHSGQMQALNSQMTAFHTEAFGNLQLIKSFGVVDAYSKRLRILQNERKTAALQFKKFSLFTSILLSFTGLAVSSACFLCIAYRLYGGYITYGEMTLFLQMASTLSASFHTLVGMVPTTIAAATCAGRVMELTQLPAEQYPHKQQADALLAENAPIHLHLENVDFAYEDDQWVLKNASLEAHPGQIVALVGPSGGGKTTLLRVLLGIVDIQKGDAYLEAGQARIPFGPSTRKLFSYVPQDNTLFSGTIRENLLLMHPNATDPEIWEALRLACAEDFVKESPDRLDTVVGERGFGLSQGQIQRLSIARALLSPAPVLLLDEATSALDAETESKLLCNLVSHHENRTYLVTTHRMSVLNSAHKVYRVGQQTVTLQ